MKWIVSAIALFAFAVVAVSVGQKQQLELGSPVATGALSVIPILTTEKANVGKYITLAEATRRGLVEIVEIPGREQVNALEVRNKADL
ncbi:MAG: ARPP-1 family domain-containing protein, partial [Fimbriimonadales bacterium]